MCHCSSGVCTSIRQRQRQMHNVGLGQRSPGGQKGRCCQKQTVSLKDWILCWHRTHEVWWWACSISWVNYHLDRKVATLGFPIAQLNQTRPLPFCFQLSTLIHYMLPLILQWNKPGSAIRRDNRPKSIKTYDDTLNCTKCPGLELKGFKDGLWLT